MTTETMPTVGQFFLMKLASKLRNQGVAREGSTRAHAWIQTLIRLVLHVAGFGCLTYAGFIWHPAAGFVVAGLSLFLLSWLTTSRGTPTPQPVNHSWQTGDRRG